MPSEPSEHSPRRRKRNVAEEVVADDDVVLLREAHELHGAIVGENVLELPPRGNSALCTAVTTCFHSTPDFITLCFSAEETLLRALTRQLEGDAGDALDLAGSCRAACRLARFSPVSSVTISLGSPEIDAPR